MISHAHAIRPSLVIVFLLIIFGTGSCVNHDIERVVVSPCDELDVSFVTHLKPIITTNCAVTGCHNGDNGADRNWTIFSNFQAKALEVKRRVSLPISNGDHMPMGGVISDDEIKLLVCWVDQGAKDN
jgi:hypothetical protein